MQLRPLSEHVGTEVTGIAMAALDDAGFEQLRHLVYDRGVAVLRDQDLTPQQHIAFARRWGGIDINNYFPLNGEHPEIAEVRKEADQMVNIGGGWHTDHSYDQIPAMGSILVARELPPSGGDTLFSSMGAAYDALSDGLKATLENLNAVHSADHIYSHDGVYAQTDQASALRGHDLKTRAGPSGRDPPSGDGPQAALCQRRFHPPFRRLDPRGKQAAARLSLHAWHPRGVPVQAGMEARHGGDLG